MTELDIIKKYYGTQRSGRSKVPYINHIKEGLVILDEIGASHFAKAAYCLHPIVQSDIAFEDSMTEGSFFWEHHDHMEPYAVVLVMEYRSVANAYLSDRHVLSSSEIELGPSKEVKHMLVADKVQNKKDFMIHHYGNHERSGELSYYFHTWLSKLGISKEEYERLVKLIS